MTRISLIPAAILALSASSLLAHSTLEQKQAEMNSTYKAVMRVPHGCDGEATLKLRISIPEGVIAVKPMPKAGWTLETVITPYAKTYDYYGPRSEGVTEIIWSGRLEDAHYDEFIFRGRITDDFEADQMIYFPTIQECANGTQEWINIPAEGQDPHDVKGPAPGLKVIEAGHKHHH